MIHGGFLKRYPKHMAFNTEQWSNLGWFEVAWPYPEKRCKLWSNMRRKLAAWSGWKWHSSSSWRPTGSKAWWTIWSMRRSERLQRLEMAVTSSPMKVTSRLKKSIIYAQAGWSSWPRSGIRQMGLAHCHPLQQWGAQSAKSGPRDPGATQRAARSVTVTLEGSIGSRKHRPPFRVAGVALMELGWLCGALGSRLSPWLFVWQAWQSEASTSILCGRCGTWRHQLSLCVAGVAFMAVGWLVPVCRRGSLSGVAIGSIHLHSVWQAWHLATSTFTLCGRRGTYGTGLALVARLVPVCRRGFCVAGVAIGSIDLHSVWQVWHLATSTFPLCGRRGTCTHPPPFCMAGVALGDINLHAVWQAWHLWHRGSLCVWRDHRKHPTWFCGRGVALGDIDFPCVWQVWHLWHWAGSGGTLGSRLSPRLFVWPFGSIHLHSVWQACGDGWIYLEFI